MLELKSMNIWVWIEHRDGVINPETIGLICEARRFLSNNTKACITALAFGDGLQNELGSLAAHGVDRVIYRQDDFFHHYHGELFAKCLNIIAKTEKPDYIFMVQNAETADLAPRLSALMETALITRAVDFKIEEDNKAVAIRPGFVGHVYEHLSIKCNNPPVICFLPSILTHMERPEVERNVDIVQFLLDDPQKDLKMYIKDIIEASAMDLDLEEADIVVAGGRGVGEDEKFDVLHELAGLLGGPVGGTRPIIDWDTLPYERQIGQTGKIVNPRLLINCGISGANEYTAGIEKSKLTISINKDEQARIFEFSDLGIIGDVHEILPKVIDQIKQIQKP